MKFYFYLLQQNNKMYRVYLCSAIKYVVIKNLYFKLNASIIIISILPINIYKYIFLFE